MASTQDLGRAIQEARKTANLTQDELSDKAGLAYSTLAKIERGAIKNPSVFTVAGLAAAMGLSVEQLLGTAALTPVKHDHDSSTPRFLFVDVNGVLVRSFQGAFTALAGDSGAHVERIENTFWHFNDAVCRGEVGVAEFNAALRKLTGLKDVDWADYYLKSIRPVPAMQDTLETLADEVPIGLLTNTFPGLVKEMIKRRLLPDIKYAAIVDSSEVGAIKPQTRIYQAAEEVAGVKPSEILFVDDNRTNLSAAEKLGWRVLWFDDYRVAESVRRVKAAVRTPVS